jgi:syntaxin 16
MFLGACRNLTIEYSKHRDALRGDFKEPSNAEYDSLISPSVVVDVSPDTPAWARTVKEVHSKLDQVEQLLPELSKAHNKKLRVDFGPQQRTDLEIDDLTNRIKQLIKESRDESSALALEVANEPPSKRTVILNVLRSFAILITARNNSFRSIQKEYANRLKDLENVQGQFDPGLTKLLDAEAEDTSWDPEDQLRAQELKQHSTERMKRIIEIAQSVNDLHLMFQEVNNLVLEQGTILDRIDYQVDQTLANVKKGNINLVKANKHSSKAAKLKIMCIIGLVIMCTLEIIILVIQLNGGTSSSSSSSTNP